MRSNRMVDWEMSLMCDLLRSVFCRCWGYGCGCAGCCRCLGKVDPYCLCEEVAVLVVVVVGASSGMMMTASSSRSRDP